MSFEMVLAFIENILNTSIKSSIVLMYVYVCVYTFGKAQTALVGTYLYPITLHIMCMQTMLIIMCCVQHINI